jgi:ethanolamine utilization protein EutL
MAILDPIRSKALSVRLIPQVEADFASHLNLSDNQRSIGLITADNDDATYVSIDHATKNADVEVVYAHSFYAGVKHSSGLLSGEIVAILAGPNPEEVRSGLQAALSYLQEEALWYSANKDGSITFFPHVISRAGSYLSKLANVPLGSPLAYLVAPPMEGLIALDASLKAAAVKIVSLTMPPSETNYMGVILSGDQPACNTAAITFRDTVLEVADQPRKF